MAFNKITEADSHHNDLEQKSIAELLQGMHQEDQKAVQAVGKVLPQVEQLIAKVVEQLQNGGRLFYIGAGTSGRLGVLDASECPPTFGTPAEKVIGLIAGGDHALRNSIEKADIVVVRFGEKYKQWNAAFDAGYAAALNKSLIIMHSDEHQHALKEVDAAALAVTKNVDEIVNILQYSVEGSLEF